MDSTSEIVFGCENMGWPVPDIKKRLEQISHDFALDNLLERNLFHLSGGEKQKIACASVTMPDPDVMVLDEPTSNLDCCSIQILADIIAVWKNNGKTVIIAEHRLNYLKAVADRVIYMEDGQIVEDVPAKQFWNLPVEVIKQRGLRSIVPVTFERMPPMYQGNGILEMKNFHFSYNGVLDLDIPSLSIPTGAVVGIIGNNGSGKTTFARCLCGLERKAAGEISIEGKVINCKKRLKNSYLVMQDVNHQLFTESVEEEVLIGMPGSEEKNRPEADNILKSMDLLPLKELHPLSLSGGQKQRVAVASALSSRKKILVFDEPTSGLDYHHMIEVAENIRQLSAMGKTLFIITHDGNAKKAGARAQEVYEARNNPVRGGLSGKRPCSPKETRYGTLRRCGPAHGGVKAQRVPCSGYLAGRRFSHNGRGSLSSSDRGGPRGCRKNLRATSLLYRASHRRRC